MRALVVVLLLVLAGCAECPGPVQNVAVSEGPPARFSFVRHDSPTGMPYVYVMTDTTTGDEFVLMRGGEKVQVLSRRTVGVAREAGLLAEGR